MKLKPLALGLAGGIFWGLMMFATTWLSHYTGYAELFLKAFTQIYPGYTVSPMGSIVVLPYGFVDGFVFGAALAWLYNKFAKD
ncbi:MAG: bacteriophage holin [Nitrospirota bacterium]|jgi:hypothetical protein